MFELLVVEKQVAENGRGFMQVGNFVPSSPAY
jgi:hypothetical protein